MTFEESVKWFKTLDYNTQQSIIAMFIEITATSEENTNKLQAKHDKLMAKRKRSAYAITRPKHIKTTKRKKK